MSHKAADGSKVHPTETTLLCSEGNTPVSPTSPISIGSGSNRKGPYTMANTASPNLNEKLQAGAKKMGGAFVAFTPAFAPGKRREKPPRLHDSEIYDLHRRLDTSGDDEIDINEWNTVAFNLGLCLRGAENYAFLRKVFDQANKRRTGKLDREEFKAAYDLLIDTYDSAPGEEPTIFVRALRYGKPPGVVIYTCECFEGQIDGKGKFLDGEGACKRYKISGTGLREPAPLEQPIPKLATLHAMAVTDNQVPTTPTSPINMQWWIDLVATPSAELYSTVTDLFNIERKTLAYSFSSEMSETPVSIPPRGKGGKRPKPGGGGASATSTQGGGYGYNLGPANATANSTTRRESTRVEDISGGGDISAQNSITGVSEPKDDDAVTAVSITAQCVWLADSPVVRYTSIEDFIPRWLLHLMGYMKPQDLVSSRTMAINRAALVASAAADDNIEWPNFVTSLPSRIAPKVDPKHRLLEANELKRKGPELHKTTLGLHVTQQNLLLTFRQLSESGDMDADVLGTLLVAGRAKIASLVALRGIATGADLLDGAANLALFLMTIVHLEFNLGLAFSLEAWGTMIATDMQDVCNSKHPLHMDTLAFIVEDLSGDTQPLIDGLIKLVDEHPDGPVLSHSFRRRLKRLLEERNLPRLVSTLNRIYSRVNEDTGRLRTLYQQKLDEQRNSLTFVLTIFTVGSWPLTFFTGVFGMNFDNMTYLEADTYPAVPGVSLFYLLCGLSMIVCMFIAWYYRIFAMSL